MIKTDGRTPASSGAGRDKERLRYVTINLSVGRAPERGQKPDGIEHPLQSCDWTTPQSHATKCASSDSARNRPGGRPSDGREAGARAIPEYSKF